VWSGAGNGRRGYVFSEGGGGGPFRCDLGHSVDGKWVKEGRLLLNRGGCSKENGSEKEKETDKKKRGLAGKNSS